MSIYKKKSRWEEYCIFVNPAEWHQEKKVFLILWWLNMHSILNEDT